MSPSPTWCAASETPLGQALAAAQHDAWRVSEDRRHAIFVERFRQLVGPERAEPLLVAAIALFTAQPAPPAGFEGPPSVLFEICPRCQRLSSARHHLPNGGRLKLQVLRDQEWLAAQFAQGRTARTIARQLGCSPENVTYWAERHGLDTPKTGHARDLDAEVAARHRAGEAPGTIARALGIKVQHVRQVLARTGLATNKRGHHYMQREWWEERIVRRGLTTRECAREAGLKPHGCAYWLKQFGLQEITKARGTAALKRRWRLKYPVLADPVQLRALLDHHGTYEAVGKHLGCSPTLVSSWARKLLGAAPRTRTDVPYAARDWWTERLARGLTTWQLADEAGIAEKSAREKLRTLGAELLAHAYRNNTAAEKAKRKGRAA